MLLHPALQKWSIFNLLHTECLLEIRMAIVCGWLGNVALIVTTDESVYAIRGSCRRSGNIQKVFLPKVVKSLSNKYIETFVHSKNFVLALTQNGKLYVWTYTCMHDVECTKEILMPSSIEEDEYCVDIACGEITCMALTNKGKVYFCNIQWKLKYACVSQCAVQVIELPGKNFISISFELLYCMAATDDGKIYVFDTLKTSLCPNTVEVKREIAMFSGTVIEKIVSGCQHTLVLTKNGLWAWGLNRYGELGVNSKLHSDEPLQVHLEPHKKVVNIAASIYNYTSVAMTEDNEVYVWGDCLGQKIMVPMRLPVKSMEDVFASFTGRKVTHEPIIINTEGANTSLVECLRESFDNESTSDLVIKVSGKPIYVHRVVLRIRSRYFREKLGKDTSAEDDKSITEHDQFSYNVYKAFLKYLYTAEIDLIPEDMLELLKLAHLYSETVLEQHTLQLLTREITVQNTVTFYCKALENDIKALEKYCLLYARKHMNNIVHTSAFLQLSQSAAENFHQNVMKSEPSSPV